jgi:hypothetical protein
VRDGWRSPARRMELREICFAVRLCAEYDCRMKSSSAGTRSCCGVLARLALGREHGHVREVIVVEGRYDKNTLRQIVDSTIVETGGFGVFRDKERLALLRALAARRGWGADGRRRRRLCHPQFLKGAIPPEQVKHAYIPDVYGREKRKSSPSARESWVWRARSPRCSWRRSAGPEQRCPRGRRRPGTSSPTRILRPVLTGVGAPRAALRCCASRPAGEDESAAMRQALRVDDDSVRARGRGTALETEERPRRPDR